MKEKIRKKKTFAEVMKSRWGGFIVITVFSVVFLLISSDNNVFTWLAARKEMKEQERLIRNYCKEINEMDEWIHSRTDNRDSLETFARERFHFAEPGEDVYLVDE